ncbi:uncharacterized protein LOC126978027 [Leptidea sinapis]|uniref:uncharacterized protein LOC126978027 n=1 Tax=Leptidea sinapis TaxID=189913 RepID=UPI0021C295A0|nr:uncharacterized protein LOC126978027 [Leptidea sinapis]
MYSLVNSDFNRTYNPSGKQNALSDIKRLLTSRDTTAQAKACGYLIEVISRYDNNLEEKERLVEYLLDNDIVVFLCEVTSNLDFNLFTSVLRCMRLLWTARRFFEEQAPHAMAAVLRAMSHFLTVDSNARDACLHFLCDLLSGISAHKTTSPLSYQSAYSTDQLLACFSALSTRINMASNPKCILSSALVLHELISYQPDDLVMPASMAKEIGVIVKTWFEMLVLGLNHTSLVGNDEDIALILIVTCNLGIDTLRLSKNLENSKPPTDFVQTILVDANEIESLRQCSTNIQGTVLQTIGELAVFVKDNLNTIGTEEYKSFLKFLLNFYYDAQSDMLIELSDVLFTKGYLSSLPRVQIERNDMLLRKISTFVLGELLKSLIVKYLLVNDDNIENCHKHIQMGLVELQNGIENPRCIGTELQKSQPYSLLIYIYFYCQSSDNPEECTSQLLPYLVEHILRLQKTLMPPLYITKALWLVFAMSTISNGAFKSLEERVYLEKATDRIVTMIQANIQTLYTHNPAILFWAFSSVRIPNYVRRLVLTQWLNKENSLPEDLTKEPLVWQLLLSILTQSKDPAIVSNCVTTLNRCLETSDDEVAQEFGTLIWSMLPDVLSTTLINYENVVDWNICYLLDIATTLVPRKLNDTVCLKISVLVTTLLSKALPDTSDIETKDHFQYVCLTLCLIILQFSNEKNDNRVLLTYANKSIFLANVLSCITSGDDSVACAALRLLSNIVYSFQKNNYQPNSLLQIRTDEIVKCLRQDSSVERDSSVLQLVFTVLNSGFNTPIAMTYSFEEIATDDQECCALRALMFRVQIVLCYRDSEHRTSIGWKTLSSIFKHTIIYKNDSRLVNTLTCQPWIYSLIRFTLAQEITVEFLTFLNNWISLLRIAIKKNMEIRKTCISKNSIITRTMNLLKKSLPDENYKDTTKQILEVSCDILDNYCNNN